MSRESKLTDEERIAAVEYFDGKGSYAAIAKKYGISLETVRQMPIENGKNHSLAVEKYSVSRQQVYPVNSADHNRDFNADKPNEKWLADVTEFKYYVS